MKIDTTSFCVNSRVTGQAGGQAAWGTSLGQERAKGFPVQMDREGVPQIVAGMLHNACTDRDGLKAAGMSSSRELILFSVFDRVYVNGAMIPGASFIMSVVREHTKTSEGKLHLSYAPYYTYSCIDKDGRRRTVSNAETIQRISDSIGCGGGSWFVRKIEIADQHQLHMRAVVVNAATESIYATHAERSHEWDRLAVMDRLNESGTLLPLSSESFRAYLTGLLPSAMSMSRASALCKSVDTTLVRDSVRKVTGKDVSLFSLDSREDVVEVLERVRASHENNAVYSGVPAEALSLYCDFLEATEKNRV